MATVITPNTGWTVGNETANHIEKGTQMDTQLPVQRHRNVTMAPTRGSKGLRRPAENIQQSQVFNWAGWVVWFISALTTMAGLKPLVLLLLNLLAPVVATFVPGVPTAVTGQELFVLAVSGAAAWFGQAFLTKNERDLLNPAKRSWVSFVALAVDFTLNINGTYAVRTKLAEAFGFGAAVWPLWAAAVALTVLPEVLFAIAKFQQRKGN